VQRGVTPGLAVVLAGDDPASKVYVRNKTHACEEVGVRSQQIDYPASVAQEDLIARIRKLNADPAVHGILVQLPLPKHIDSARVLAAVAPEKDVDGFHESKPRRPASPAGAARRALHPRGRDAPPRACGRALAGRHAVVIGRSNIVGKPGRVASLAKGRDRHHLSFEDERPGRNMPPGRCPHRRRGARETRHRHHGPNPAPAVIDVGVNRLPDGKLARDVDFDAVKEVAGAITPVPMVSAR